MTYERSQNRGKIQEVGAERRSAKGDEDSSTAAVLVDETFKR
jgi:hypothetical protein